MRGIPKALDDAAYMDGATSLQVLWRIIVPLSRPAIASMALYIFITEWNNYIWPLVAVGKQDLYTLQIGLARLYRSNPGEGLVDRSEERRSGKEGVRQRRSRGAPAH